ncbi:Endoglucanase 3 [Hordeum vulgare]|nr:Endoglucanase 3 [Hordeum vulgare]
MRWMELRNSCEGVHEVQAIQYFIDGCQDCTLLKHKLMCSERTSLAVLMAKGDKYATADSAMRVKVTASDKIFPTLSTPKPDGDNRGGQNNKRKADQLDSRSTNKQVANVQEDAPATQAGSHRQRTSKNAWQPKLTFEQMLDTPCKMHTGAKPATHTVRQCSFAQRLLRGEDLLRLHHRCLTTTAVSTTSYATSAGYNYCVGYTGSADYNCFTGYNNNFGHAKPQIMLARHPVGGRHGGRRRAGYHNSTRDRRSRACDYINKREGCRSS